MHGYMRKAVARAIGFSAFLASISCGAQSIEVPPVGWVWYAPLFVNPPHNTDAFGEMPSLPAANVFPSPQEAATGYCQQANPTFTATVGCSTPTAQGQLPCGFSCFSQTGQFQGGSTLNLSVVCLTGEVAQQTTVNFVPVGKCFINTGSNPAKSTGCPDCNQTGGTNPINIGIGNKYELETDYVGQNAFPLRLERHYNSNSVAVPVTVTNVGGYPAVSRGSLRWTHSYSRSVNLGTDVAQVFRADGHSLFYKLVSGLYQADADTPDRLEQILDGSGQRTGWKLTVAKDDSVELYDQIGRLTSITNRAGLTQTLAYDANGRLLTVSDPFGATLTFAYDANGRISTVTNPAGGIYTWAYDTSNRLTSVTYPDQKIRQYVYEDTVFKNGLTGIIDENGSRYATWTYEHTSGRAVSSEHAGGVDHVSVPDAAHVTDAFNNTRAFAQQNVVGVSKTSGITGQPCPSCGNPTNTYDANGNMSSTTDWNGNRTNYTYDLTRNLETSRTEGLTSAGATTPQTRTISTQWHTTFRLPVTIAEPLRITTLSYDADGTTCGAIGALCSKTIQATTDANGSAGFGATSSGTPRTWTYTYNANGQVLTVDGPRTDISDVTTYTYYANNDADVGKRGNLATTTNAAGQTTSVTAYNADGRPLTIVDANGLTTTLTYDARQRLTSRNVGGETTTYTYDNAGQLTKVTLPDTSFLSYSYDAAHRLTGMQDNLGNKIAYTLDLMGNRTQEQVFDPGNTIVQTRSRVYSNINRLFQELGALGQTTEYGYDNQGNVTSVKDPNNHTSTNQYDALNRLKQVTDPGLGVTQYAYNGLDALTQVTDPRSLVTGYTVDGLGNLNQQSSPDTGNTVNTYDAAGNLLTQTDAKSQVTAYTYDALNRVTLITFQDGAKQTYAYDQGTNGIGRLSSITETNPSNAVISVIAYAYDQHGRVTSETRTVNSVQYVLGYSYDASGRLSGMTYPSGRSIAYTFDALGRVNQVNTTADGQQQVVVQNVAYQPFGVVKSYTLGNGQIYSRTVDQDGRIASYTLGNANYQLTYDPASRITGISEVGNPSNANTYGYDALDRLTSAVLPSSSFGYAYDAVGNRTTKTTGANTDTYTYSPSSNRIATLTPSGSPTRSFVFDANGSTTDDGANTYAYDTRGRMVQATNASSLVTSYQVNALGQRIRKTNANDDRVFLYDTRGKLIAETDPAGTLKRELIYLGDIPVGVVQ